ncbi:retropepsin-like aspartic protease family protein [Pseudomonas abieticivorans]|uniref:retropepsin-like aspartic protease family protein n=1 Tax=Pseudomonas abieticivorans TaxID=2931382 RepID=UPI003F68D0B8
MSSPVPGRRAGRFFFLLAWIAGLYLATRFFAGWEQREENPNQVVGSQHGQGYVEVNLLSNRQGHFVADGRVNGQKVQFMVDTGATFVAVPEPVARRLELERGMPVALNTANGRTQGYQTQLASLQLGDITLKGVRAVVMPGLDDEQILLGMSALKQLEFTQRGGNLLLRQTTK